jgi:hypothetical protein
MRFENNMGSVFNLGQMFMMCTYPLVPSIYPGWFDYRFVIIFMNPVSLYLNGLFPALLTFPSFQKWVERGRWEGVSSENQKEMETKGTIFALQQGVDVFQAVLAHPVLLQAFMNFTNTEWCVENVLFFKAAEDYQKKFGDGEAEARARARHIIQEYITNGAPLEVNLEGSMKRAITQAYEQARLTQDTFREAQKHIYGVMQRDSFSKWKRTQDFKEALDRAVSGRTSSSFGRGSYEELKQVRVEMASSSHEQPASASASASASSA